MKIKLTQYELQEAIRDYLKKNGVNITDEQYTETFIKHSKTHTRSAKGVAKKLKTPQSYEFWWYQEGYEYNQEEIEISIFIDSVSEK